ncbi:MAG: thioredoxin domain-containing protein [Terracidiphilus sp.]
MKRIYFIVGLLALGAALGCKAQPAKQLPDAALNRRIEIMVRSQYNIPEGYSIELGVRSLSQVPGYDALPISIGHGGKATVIDFLISADNKTLARLEKFDLAGDPLFSINVAGRPIRGNPNAKVTVVSFDDLECPFCGRMHQTLFPATLERYQGLVRFIYKDNPLVEIHPWAQRAAIDANCLAAQSSDAYWQFVDYIHAHGQEVNGSTREVAKSFDALDRIARQQAENGKLNALQLDSCLAHQDATQVQDSMKEAQALHIEGAPMLYVDGERINGAVPQADVWAVIDRALRAAGVAPPTAPEEPQKPGQ